MEVTLNFNFMWHLDVDKYLANQWSDIDPSHTTYKRYQICNGGDYDVKGTQAIWRILSYRYYLFIGKPTNYYKLFLFLYK